MKGLAYVLIAMILLHGACMGRCWGETAAAPPCHPQEGEDARLCSEGPAIEAKTAPTAKCVPAAEPCVSPIPDLVALAWHSDSSIQFQTVAPPLLRFTVLRI